MRLPLAALALVLLAPAASAGHGEDDCPRFERRPYEYVLQFHHGGDLWSTLHVAGTVDLRYCVEVRHRVSLEKVRWDARGGAYELRVVGDGLDERHLLHDDANATRWYDHAAVERIEVVGLSHKARPTIILGEEPPVREASSLAGRLRGAW